MAGGRIEVRHLSKIFHEKKEEANVLKDINLTIEPGDIYGVIGMSGAGKSTLVRCLNYLEQPTRGQVLIGGRELGSMGEKELRLQRQKIGMIFQNYNLLMQKNVLDNVCFPLLIHKVNKKEAVEKARKLLQMVGLAEKESAYPAKLSGGQKQRVAIARALALDPEIILCDEATSALDPQTTESILELLKQINRELHITIVMITHQLSIVRDTCNKVAIIDQGEMVEEGTVEDVFNRPKSPAALLLLKRSLAEEAIKIREEECYVG